MPPIRVLLLKVVQAADYLVLNFFRFPQLGELRLRPKQNHGCHIGSIERIDKVRISVQPITDELERCQLIWVWRIKGLELIPLTSRRCWIIKVIHYFDDVSIVCAVEVQMVLSLQLGGWPLVVVIESKWWAIHVLPV